VRLRLPSDRHARAIYIQVMLVKPHCQGNTTAVALAACWVLPRLVIGSCLVLGSDRGLPHTEALMGTNIGAWHEERGSRGRGVLLVSVRLGLRTTTGSWFRDDRFDVHVRPSQVFRALRSCSSADDLRSIVHWCPPTSARRSRLRRARSHTARSARQLGTRPCPRPRAGPLGAAVGLVDQPVLDRGQKQTFHAGIVMRLDRASHNELRFFDKHGADELVHRIAVGPAAEAIGWRERRRSNDLSAQAAEHVERERVRMAAKSANE
jgi:hypothetical protein